MTYTETRKIAEINDSLRQTFAGGKVLLTRGIMDTLDEAGRGELIRRIKEYNSFDKSNDPYQEHDFGVVIMGNETYFWKIDYYDRSLQYGSSDPSDPAQTARVLTIMLAEEY